MKIKKSTFALICFLLLFSCSKEKPLTATGRTILLFLGGNNNLSTELEPMKESILKGMATAPVGSNLLIYEASSTAQPRLLQVTGCNACGKPVQYETLATYSASENSASPAVLKRAISDMQKLYPSSSYGLLVFSHATGWLPPGAFEFPYTFTLPTVNTSRSLIMNGREEMAFSDFVNAIPNGLFDFIGFNMCFMGGIETTYALRNKTPYILASATEIVSPGFTPIFATNMADFFQPTANLQAFAQAFYKYYDAQKPPYRSATISLLKTSEVGALATLLKPVIAAAPCSLNTNLIQPFDRKAPHLFFDIQDYVKNIANTSTQTQIQEQLNKVVVYKQATNDLIDLKINTHSGLSIYIPQAGLDKLNTAYTQTDWYKATR